MRIIYLILVIIFSFFIVTFSLANSKEMIQLHYYNFLVFPPRPVYLIIPPVPAYLVIFASLLLGVIITAFWGVVERFRLNRTIRRLNKMVRDLRRKLHANETPPIIDDQETPK